MNGIMTPNEIVREYRAAKDKKKELGVLADLNECSKAEIAQILTEGGEKADKRWYREPPKKTWQTAEEIGETEAGEEQDTSSVVCLAGDRQTPPSPQGEGKLAGKQDDRDEAILITPREAGLICEFIRDNLTDTIIRDAEALSYDVAFEWVMEMCLLYDRLGKRLDKAVERAVGDAGPYTGEGRNREEERG